MKPKIKSLCGYDFETTFNQTGCRYCYKYKDCLKIYYEIEKIKKENKND